jgi:hypothetical protein
MKGKHRRLYELLKHLQRARLARLFLLRPKRQARGRVGCVDGMAVDDPQRYRVPRLWRREGNIPAYEVRQLRRLRGAVMGAHSETDS